MDQNQDMHTTEGFFLALEVFRREGIPADTEGIVRLLKAVAGGALKLTNTPADEVAAAERRTGRRFTAAEVEKMSVVEGDNLYFADHHFARTAAGILRRMAAEEAHWSSARAGASGE